jgi:hypothetical protein
MLGQEFEASVDGDNFGLWLLGQCAYRDHCSGGVGALHRDYARWRARRGEPFPYTPRAFQAVLTGEGFQVTDAGAFGPMVYGLVLRCDLLSCGIDPPQPGELVADQTGALAAA